MMLSDSKECLLMLNRVDRGIILHLPIPLYFCLHLPVGPVGRLCPRPVWFSVVLVSKWYMSCGQRIAFRRVYIKKARNILMIRRE